MDSSKILAVGLGGVAVGVVLAKVLASNAPTSKPRTTDVKGSGGKYGPDVRRIVTGHTADGKAVVISDGVCPNVKHPAMRDGVQVNNLWRLFESPCVVPVGGGDPDEACAPDQAIPLHPPPGGSTFRVIDFSPEKPWIHKVARSTANWLPLTNVADGTTPRHPLMHRSETVDYAVCLEGEIVLVLDDSEVLVRAGDVVIQRGTNHAWANRSGSKCRMAFCLVDGRFDPHAEFGANVAVEGDELPAIEVYDPFLDDANPKAAVSIRDVFAGKKGILFGVPGAFTPTCSNSHLPGYIKNRQKLADRGVDVVACLSINDVFVMKAWGKDQDVAGIPLGLKVHMLADQSGELSRALGMATATKVKSLGSMRCARFAMLIEDNVITKVAVERDGDGVTCSFADDMLNIL